MRGGLLRTRLLNLNVATVIDVGASDGRWTVDCLDAFPNARYLLIEALALHEPKLAELRRARPNIEYVITAAGDHEGQTHFQALTDPFGGAAMPKSTDESDMIVPMTTIDLLVEKHDLAPPYCIKLDTHGFELPILNGAEKALKQTELLIVEAYNFEMKNAKPMLRFHEFCAYMEVKGFRCSDLVDPMRRQKDSLLWQMDLFFIPASRPEFQYIEFN